LTRHHRCTRDHARTEVARVFDSEATEIALDDELDRVGIQSVTYRSLLLELIRADEQVYGFDAGKRRALAFIKGTYREMRRQATAAGFSEHFAITLAEMATRARLVAGGDRDDVYLYMMKSTAKMGLRRITDRQLAATDVYEVIDVVPGTYRYRVYANLTVHGVRHVRARAAHLAAIPGVLGYKFARPRARWRRDTMVIYCRTAAATAGVLAWFNQMQRGMADPSEYFAADVPHFTKAAPELRGVSAVKDPKATDGRSYSQRMAELVRIAIGAGVDGLFDDGAAPTIASYVQTIVGRLNGFWDDPSAMRGQPKP